MDKGWTSKSTLRPYHTVLVLLIVRLNLKLNWKVETKLKMKLKHFFKPWLENGQVFNKLFKPRSWGYWRVRRFLTVNEPLLVYLTLFCKFSGTDKPIMWNTVLWHFNHIYLFLFSQTLPFAGNTICYFITTVKPPFNEPPFNEDLDITKRIFQPRY